jgi:uncharacterized protein (DUF697 family)
MVAFALLREFKAIAQESPTLAVAGAGAGELAGALRRELARGGDATAVVAGWQGAAGLIWVQAGPLSDADRAELRAATADKVPIVAIVVGGAAGAAAAGAADLRLPYVLATDHVRVGPGDAFPVDEIARALGRRLGERSSGLAARLPALRAGICVSLVKNAARRNATVGSAIPVPGADLPLLALTQVRLVLRIAHAHGEPVDTKRLPELLGVVVGAVGLRGIARQFAGSLGPGWLVKGAIAYGGTRAIGGAAIRYFERRAPAADLAH